MENDYKPQIDNLLLKRQYNPHYTPSPDDIIMSIGGKKTGSVENFVTFSGLPKTGKSSFIAALVASAFLPCDVFTLKIDLPKDRKKICYFDTESSDYDFYRQISKIKEFSELNQLPDTFNAYQVREDSSPSIRRMIERYLELNPECAVIIIDGLLDLLTNYNDERESSLLAKWLKKVTKIFKVLVITVLHQSKSNLSTTGHIGAASDRFAQSTLDIVKDRDKNTFVLSSRFMRSDSDFEPITLMNFNGIFQQVQNDSNKPTLIKKASDLDEMETRRLCSLIVTIPMDYNDIVDEIIERTANGKTFAKNLVKIWISKSLIIKDYTNKYKMR